MRNTISSGMATLAAMSLTAAILFPAGAVSAATPLPVACQSTKTKEAGTLAKCLQTAQSKLVTGGDMTKFNEAVTKCTTKFSGKWSGAEQKAIDKGGACQTTGDLAVVTDSIQRHVDCIADALQSGDQGCLLCGNGVLDAGEDCELGTMGVGTCSTATSGAAPYGTLGCGSDCDYVTSGCTAGVSVGGFSWYLSAVDGDSCDAVCAAHSLVYDAATLTYAGSSGSDANCGAVLTALGHPGSAFGVGIGLGLGCARISGSNLRDTSPTTSSASVMPGTLVYRACACQ